MPFRQAFSQLKTQLKDLQAEGQRMLSNQQPQSQQHQYPAAANHHPPPPPPPVPHGTHPSNYNPHPQPYPQVYWQARLDPATPVGAEWEHKLGNNNGWGNNEMQHYTDRGENAF